MSGPYKFKLWTEAVSEARETMVENHREEFYKKFIPIRKNPNTNGKRMTAKEKKLHDLGHLWYLEAYRLYCVKKAGCEC
jgi:hypothetical protein